MADDAARRRAEAEGAATVNRRRAVQLSVAMGLGVAGLSSLAAAVRLVPRIVVAPNQEPPAKGDLLVVAQGPGAGQVLTAASVPVDGAQVFAWPMAPGSRVVKDGDTHNLLLLVRAPDAGWFSAPDVTTQNVAAYSAICTHLCCTVSEWRAASPGAGGHGVLFCPCHLSRFDPWDRARVIDGPAPRPLPTLPLGTDGDGRLVVAGGFLAPVGCAT